MIDFTDCQQDIHRVYGGANGSKIGIEYNGHQYLLKFPPRSHPKYQHGGYANSCISEHLGCKIFRSMGIEAQDTLLGTYRLDDGREKMVPAETSQRMGAGSVRSSMLRTPACPQRKGAPGRS